jgi:arylsulfatase A-like enzyme
MRQFDRDLGTIEEQYRKAVILNRTLFVITADHGMAPITHFIPYTTIRTAISQAGTTPTSIAYNHSAYIWLHDPRKAGAVAQNLARTCDPGISSVYYLAGLGRHEGYRRAAGSSVPSAVDAANQYLLQTLLNGYEPQVVLFCRTDATTSSNSTHWRADHGGPVWQSQHIPLILSGPGIRRGVVTSRPAQLGDVAPTLLADLGVSPRGMEGRILTDALAHLSSAGQRARDAEVKQLGPLVQALIWQDSYQRSHVPYQHH